MNTWELPPGNTDGVDFYPELRPDSQYSYNYSQGLPPPYSRSSNDYLMSSSVEMHPPAPTAFQSLPRQMGHHHHKQCQAMPNRATQTLPRTIQESPQARKSVQRRPEKDKKEGFLASLKRKLTLTKKPKPRKEKWEKNGKDRSDGPAMTSTPLTSCSKKPSFVQKTSPPRLQRSASCEHSLASSYAASSYSSTSGTGWSPVIGNTGQDYRTSALRQQQKQRWSFAGPPPPPPPRPLSQVSTTRPASVIGFQEQAAWSLRERELAFLSQDPDISFTTSDYGQPIYPEPVYGSFAPRVPPNYAQHYDSLSQYGSAPTRPFDTYSQDARYSFNSQYTTPVFQYASTTEEGLSNTRQQVPVQYMSGSTDHYGLLQPEQKSQNRPQHPGEGLYVLPATSKSNGTHLDTGCECPMCYHSIHNPCRVCGCPNSLPPATTPSLSEIHQHQPPALPPKLGHDSRIGSRPRSMSSRSIEAIYSTSLENPSFKGSLSDIRKVTLPLSRNRKTKVIFSSAIKCKGADFFHSAGQSKEG